MSVKGMWEERLSRIWMENRSPEGNAVCVLAGVILEVGHKVVRELESVADQLERTADELTTLRRLMPK
jgi:hypothetical protein